MEEVLPLPFYLTDLSIWRLAFLTGLFVFVLGFDVGLSAGLEYVYVKVNKHIQIKNFPFWKAEAQTVALFLPFVD